MSDDLTAFVEHLEGRDASPHTVAAYCRDVTAFFDWLRERLEREVLPVHATSFDLRKYRDHLEALGRKPAGVNRRLAALRAFFNWAVETGQAASNPAESVKGIRHDRPAPKALTAGQVYRLQRTASERRQLAQAKAGPEALTPSVVSAYCDEALLSLLLYAGLRVAEAAALKVADLVIGERSGKVIVRAGKGRKYREVPLHREARRALRDYLAVRPVGKGDRVFLGQRGPLSERGIQLRLVALGQAADVKVTPHVLRHTFGSRLLREAEADLVTVSRLMGHKSVLTTTLYTQPTEADLAEAVEGMS